MSAAERLFAAILLDEDCRTAAAQAIDGLRAGAAAGSFTPRENLHLTLVFLGETDRADAARRALRSVEGAPFPLTFGAAGRFRRDGGDIWWLGVEPCAPLLAIQRRLAQAFRGEGFELERRAYRPHLTLGRRVALRPGFGAGEWSAGLPKLRCPVRALSLMRSERTAGGMRYTEIERQQLSRG
ncbi:RNA 2',3'-cyclic phosphodiesterase [Feifania hominis]|uniref:RNA 2',3'-cyclic phosphodiesterase n=1 Tax=Feifania hominis TaxID=2763660 RepID=A0A926DDZ3_9FIRM|nr:RNA 2',3'-cyclic phosphodiesterase [Feifania hominis]MBC8536353.1 RNA 2',3'-cyclic phosphodiesterase [Feifania hominis]